MISSIRHPEVFELQNTKTDQFAYSCDQNWYSSEWQRNSGCGPTAASNIIYYLSITQPYICRIKAQGNIESCLALMEDVWSYVTPTEDGIDTIEKFRDALQTYFRHARISSAPEILAIPMERNLRPTLWAVVEFLLAAMKEDAPVAFLNLCNGAETELEAWHWVTIVSIEYTTELDNIKLFILDESLVKEIDLLLWYNTTSLGGGFVYFDIS